MGQKVNPKIAAHNTIAEQQEQENCGAKSSRQMCRDCCVTTTITAVHHAPYIHIQTSKEKRPPVLRRFLCPAQRVEAVGSSPQRLQVSLPAAGSSGQADGVTQEEHRCFGVAAAHGVSLRYKPLQGNGRPFESCMLHWRTTVST